MAFRYVPIVLFLTLRSSFDGLAHGFPPFLLRLKVLIVAHDFGPKEWNWNY